MIRQDNQRKKLTRFSLDEVLKVPLGVVQDYETPMDDRQGNLKLVITEGMGILEGTMIADKPTKPLAHFNERPFVEMNFMLQGSISQTNEGLLDKYPFTKGYHNILFNPRSVERNCLDVPGTHRIFSVHMVPERMATLFTGYVPELAHLAEKIQKEESFVLHSPDNRLSGGLKSFFDDFWNCPAPLSLRKLYFESKVLDLLCRQTEILIDEQSGSSAIPKKDLAKLYYAREYLLDHLSDPPSLAALSRICNLNEFKLKKYFRQIFQTSVFGLLQEERLKAARQLIHQGEKNISTIAYDMGYAHPQHFQRAFKKRFGITPKSLLK